LTAFVVLALLMTPRAHAQFTGKAAATLQFESNSNVFYVNSGFPLPATAGARRADTFLAYGALFDLQYLLGRQQFFATASITRSDYQHDTQLDNEAYKLDAGMKWVLGALLDGKIDILRTRNMVPFYDLTGTQELSLQTEQRETLDVGLKLTPEWRLEGSAYTSKLDEPLPLAPNLSLTDTAGKITVRYLGITRFTGGWYVGYESGSYQGGELGINPDYHQATAGLTTTYLSPRTSFEGQLGYSRRTSALGTDDTSGITGGISLKERLTVKTALTFTLTRAIQNYVFNAGSEIDTSAGVAAEWQATRKLGVTLGYVYDYRDYPGQGNNPVGSERVDIQSSARLEIDYRPREWLSIRPYANVQWRISDFIGGEFNSNIFGINIRVQTPGK
jgi:Putative beta-barrel porin 2